MRPTPPSTRNGSDSHHPPARRRRQLKAVGAAAALLTATIALLSAAHATPGSKESETVLAEGLLPLDRQYRTREAGIEIDRLSIRPGGHSGWHTHSGPLILVVKQGTLTNYVAGPRGCTRSAIRAGKPFLEPANTPHLARNEGKRTAVFYAVVNFRKGGEAADDAPRPAGCNR